MKKAHWTLQEKEFVFNNLQKLNASEIAVKLGKTERAVNLFLFRHRRSPRAVVKNNIILCILQATFINPEYFMPTRAFYEAVKISQKRWWALYRGTVQATEEEYRRVARHLGVDNAELFEKRQTDLFK